MKPEEIDDIIESYVMNKLSEFEKSTFEDQLKNHPEWLEKLKLHQTLLNTINPNRQAFINTLTRLNAITKNENKSTSQTLKIITYLIFTSIIILLCIWLYIKIVSPKNQLNRLYNTYMVAPVTLRAELTSLGITTESVITPEADSILNVAELKYVDGKIDEATSTLEEYKGISDSNLLFFPLALLYLIQGKADDAISFLEISNHDQNEISWYKAMAYLKLKEQDLCVEELLKINDHNRWAAKSKILLQKLNLNDVKKSIKKVDSTFFDTLRKPNTKIDKESLPFVLTKEIYDSNDVKIMAFAKLEIFDPFSNITLRTIDENQKIEIPIRQYLSGEYISVVKILDSINLDDSFTEALFLKGLVYYKIQKFSQSKNIFAKLKTLGIFQEDPLEWNILLCIISEGNKNSNEFNQLLNKILENKNHTFNAKALKLRNLIY